jgi:hypothetical protein
MTPAEVWCILEGAQGQLSGNLPSTHSGERGQEEGRSPILRGTGRVLNDEALDELQYQVDQQDYHQHRYDQSQRVPRHRHLPLLVTNPYAAA